jgi:putative membrane protein
MPRVGLITESDVLKIGRWRIVMGSFLWLGLALLFLFLLLILVGGGVVVVVLLARSGSRAGSSRGDDALEILRQRYARGEIDREEYERMREDLQS